jgi:hypothetical protein
MVILDRDLDVRDVFSRGSFQVGEADRLEADIRVIEVLDGRL